MLKIMLLSYFFDKTLMINHEFRNFIVFSYNNINRNQRFSFILDRKIVGAMFTKKYKRKRIRFKLCDMAWVFLFKIARGRGLSLGFWPE